MKNPYLVFVITFFLTLGVGAILVAEVTLQFASSRQYDTGTPPAFDPGTGDHSMNRGDFDGDGVVDVVLLNPRATPENISVFPGNGAGGLGAPIVTTLTEGPSQVQVGDFDEDGVLDVVGSLYFWSDEISLVQIFYGDSRNNFRGEFQPGPTFAGAVGPAGENLRVTSVADFNNDGHLDVTVGYPANWTDRHVEVYFGDGNGGMTLAHDLIGEVLAVDVADVDGDGFTDLVGSSGGALVFLNQGDGSFGASIKSFMRSGQFILPDVDADGTPDFVTLTYANFNEPWDVRIALGQGDGTFVVSGEYAVVENQSGTSLVAGDFDGDGIIDFVAGMNKTDTFFLRGNGDGTVSDIRHYYAGGLYGIALNLDTDGHTDLVTGGVNPGALSTTLGIPQGLAASPIVDAGVPGSVMTTGDINGDGLRDILSGSLSVLMRNGSGGFLPAVSYTPSRPARALATGDLNGDGYDDVVVGSLPASGLNLEILVGAADGSLTHFADMHNGSGIAIFERGLALADMNGDSKLDIITTAFATMSVLINNGDATFGGAIMTGTGSASVTSMLVRDFNNDGFLDAVALWDSVNEDFAHSYADVNLGNGDGTFSYVQRVFIDGRMTAAVAARMDGDGLPDIMAGATAGTHSGPGGLYFLRNTGGTFTIAWHDASSPVHHLGAADFTHDGVAELVIMHAENPFFQGPNLEVWINDGAGAFGEIITLAAPDQPQALVVDDVSGSSQPDFAILNASGNGTNMVVLFENKAQVTTAVRPGDTPAVAGGPRLVGNHPNPFNPTTTIVYDLPSSVAVQLTIHDLAGRRIATLVNQVMSAGEHRSVWKGRNSVGRGVASGVYFVRLAADGQVVSKKMVLLK